MKVRQPMLSTLLLWSASSVLTLAAPAAQLLIYAMRSYLLPILCSLPRNPLSNYDVVNVLHPGSPTSSFPRHHFENTRLNKITPIVSACMSKEDRFLFDNLGKKFASCLKFIQYSLVCPFLRPTYLQHSSLAPHFSCF